MAEHCGSRHFGGPEDAHPFSLPGAVEHYAAERPVRVRHVKLEVELDFARRSVAGRCVTDLEAVRKVDSISFDAVDLEISEVRVNGKRATFGNSGRHVHVKLPVPLLPEDAATVEIRYSAEPTRGLYFWGPDEGQRDRPVQAWTQGQDEDSRCWFPCLDAPAQKATTELIATIPAKFTALSNGQKLSDQVRGKRRVIHYRLDVPHSPYLVTLAVGEFEEVTAKVGKTQLRYLFTKGQKADALRVVGRTPQMVKVFEEVTGRGYPYGTYSQIFVTEFIFGGMENTSATTLTDVVLHDEKVHGEYRDSAESLIAHELAHQWFGDLLTCRDWPHGWLNEGFATYFESLWKESADGVDEMDHARREDLVAYLAETSNRYARAIVARKFHEPIDLFDRHLYEKGGLVLHELRRRLGDEPFFSALRNYVEENEEGTVETVDLARAVERATGHNVDRFFDQYVFSRGHPTLAADVSFEAADKVLKVKVRQTQTTTGENAFPVFELPLDIVIAFGGRERKERVLIKDAEHTFLLPCDREPTQVRLDERREILGTLAVTKGAQLWIAELQKAPFARSRTEAAVALGKDGSNRAVAALGRQLPKEAFWGTGAAIAKALGQIRTDGAKKVLLANLGIANPKVRRAIVAALGEFKRDADASKALRGIVERGDSSPFVEGEAARAFGKVKAESVLPVLEKLLTRKSFQDVIASGAIDGIAEAKSREAYELIEPLTRYGQRQYVRRSAAMALGRVAEPAEQKARAVEVLSDLLRDKQFRVQMVAFDAVVTLGDRRAIGPLESIPFLDGRARRAAREAIRSLREGAPQAKEVAALREELDKLKEETRGVKERLEALAMKPATRKGGRGK